MATLGTKKNSLLMPYIDDRGRAFQDAETKLWSRYITSKEFIDEFVDIKPLNDGLPSQSVDIVDSDMDADGKVTVTIDVDVSGITQEVTQSIDGGTF
jgi:hypothetical protein